MTTEIPTMSELLDMLEEERRMNNEKDAEIVALQELKRIWEKKYHDLQHNLHETWQGIHVKNREAAEKLRVLIDGKTENKELADSLIGIFNNLTANLAKGGRGIMR